MRTRALFIICLCISTLISLRSLFVPYERCDICEDLSSSYCIKGPGVKPFTEWIEVAKAGLVIVPEMLLTQIKSDFQDIAVYTTSFWGNILVIDSVVQLTERDESHYHEMLVHVPMAYIPTDTRLSVVIIGGGDGGVLRDLLRHSNVDSVTLVDIDPSVTDVCREFFPDMASGFDGKDGRVMTLAMDGAVYVKSLPKASVDLLLLDSTEDNQAMTLFTDEFYVDVKRALKPTGHMVQNFDNLFVADTRAADRLHGLRAHFKYATAYQAIIPSFATGYYSFLLLSDTVNPLKQAVDWKPFLRKQIGCRYYSPSTHMAAFALPKFVHDLLGQPAPELTLVPPSEFSLEEDD